MSAFFDTNGPEDMSWLLVSEGLIAELEKFLPKSAELSSLPTELHRAENKKALWLSLAR